MSRQNNILSVLSRLFTGKTAFRPEDTSQGDQDAWREPIIPDERMLTNADKEDIGAPTAASVTALEKNPYIDAHGQKIRPRLVIERCMPKLHGDRMEVWAMLYNDSNFTIEVDKMVLLGQTREYNQFLQPHQAKQLLIYQGPVPRTGNDRKARAYYKITNNTDAFMAEYYIKYETEGDGDFLIDELDIIDPVRDV